MKTCMIKVGFGQDSHRFLEKKSDKKCVIGGVVFSEMVGLDADSDGDVVYHAICNAITSVTHLHILGDKAIEMCRSGITDSRQYLLEAKKSLEKDSIQHIAISIEGKKPRMQVKLVEMRKNIAVILDLDVLQVGITCTSGNNLNDFGKGIGIQCFCLITFRG